MAYPERRAGRAELSERRMFEAAIRLIVERGVSGTTLTDVGLRAGYSRGLAAMRFGTKAGLLRRLVDHLGSQWIARLGTATRGLHGTAAVRAAIGAQAAALADNPREMRALYAILFQSADPGAEYHADISRAFNAQRRDMMRWFGQAAATRELRLGVDSEGAASLTHSAMLGVVYQWMMDPALPGDSMHGKLTSILDHALMGQPPADPGHAHDRKALDY